MISKVERLNRELVHEGKIINLYEDTVKIPKNGNICKWDFIGHKGASAVLPVLDDGRILMVIQYRNALDRITIEIPAGGIEDNEESIVAAKRELLEETGYDCKEIKPLISVIPTVAYCNEKIDVFLATGLELKSQHLDENEEIEIKAFDIDELCEMVYSMEIKDSKTVAAVMAYKNKYC